MATDLSKREDVLAALREAEQEASTAWAAAEKLKADMIASDVNPLTDAEAFEKVDEAYKAHSVAEQHALDLRDRLGAMTSWGQSRPQAQRPIPGDARPNRALTAGMRFTEHERVVAAMESMREMSRDEFIRAFGQGNALGGAIDVLSRDELAAVIAPGRFGATTVTGGSATSAGPFIQNDLVPGYIDYRLKRPTLASVVGRGQTDSDTVEYVTQSAGTNEAKETAETNAADETTIAFATNTVDVKEITHYVPVTQRAMQDAGQVRTIIEQELLRFLLDRLDTQLASGGGTGDDMEGIYTAVSQAQAVGADTKTDALHKAMTQIRIAPGVFMDPDYIGIHPSDYESLILEQDGTGQYLYGPPSQAGARAAWGVPFLVSTVFTSGTPLVGNYEMGARMWLRAGATVSSGLNGTDFVNRRISLLATMRLAFKTIRPTAFTEVTGF